MMIPKNSVTYVILLMCVTKITRAGNHLINDTCHTVLIREDITKRAAKVVCNDTARVFDPKSQNGTYLLEDTGTGNWTGEIFACLCSCRLPFDPENGQILPKNRIYMYHGETLDYSCNEGYEKNIEKRIVCYDGLLMTVPDFLKTQHINTAFRQKSLPDWFANNWDGKVFDLWVNETANWSIPETEVKKNQKVFQILTKNEMLLQYYVFSGKGCMLGFINLERRGLECRKMIGGNTTTASSDEDKSTGLLVSFIVAIVVSVIVLITVVIAVVCKLKKRSRHGEHPHEVSLINQGN